MFSILAILALWSCGEKELPEVNFCTDDNAEFYANNTLVNTTHTPGGGEILTPGGENCGLGAVYFENSQILTMRIFVENHSIYINAEISSLNQELEFSNVDYTNTSTNTIYSDLIESSDNFILVESLDTTDNSMNGTFNFQVANDEGETMNITNGSFDCFFHRI